MQKVIFTCYVVFLSGEVYTSTQGIKENIGELESSCFAVQESRDELIDFSQVGTGAGGVETDAHSIVHKYGLNMTPILIKKCVVDIGREVLLKSLETKPWIVLALDLCSEYFCDAICEFARNGLVGNALEESDVGRNPGGSASLVLFKLLGIPIGLSVASFAICKASNLMQLNDDYTWFAATQTFSLFLFAKNLMWQIEELTKRVDTHAKAKIIDAGFRIITKYFPTLAGLAHFLHIDRFLESECDDGGSPLLPDRRATLRDVLSIISTGSLFIGAKMLETLTCFYGSSWAFVGAVLLEAYCKGEFYKMLSLMKDPNFQYNTAGRLSGEDSPLLAQICTGLLVPLTVIAGILFAKEFTLMSDINVATAQFIAYSLGVLGLWWNNVSLHKDILEKNIVGYNIGPIHTLYSIVQKIVPGLPDIAKIFDDVQKLAISIVYP
ncbi:MAG: hypothetical protein LBF84_02995 [Holosporales bacterium]|jgi:hypothetical protein|nr:hypothetical protein [Holosporales bacterium]